jgi:hypothetical protein
MVVNHVAQAFLLTIWAHSLVNTPKDFYIIEEIIMTNYFDDLRESIKINPDLTTNDKANYLINDIEKKYNELIEFYRKALNFFGFIKNPDFILY